jgi:hypothetical protein
MDRQWVVAAFVALFFVLGFLISLDQYIMIGVWFQIEDIHHETFMLSSLAMGLGILIGAIIRGGKEK